MDFTVDEISNLTINCNDTYLGRKSCRTRTRGGLELEGDFASWKIPQRPCYSRNCHFVASCFATARR